MYKPEMPIEYLRLMPRTYGALIRNKVETVGELMKLSGGQVRAMRGIGRKGYQEIVAVLEKENVKLPTFPEEFVKHIYKVQMPLFSSGEEAQALAYNKERPSELFLPVTQDLLDIMGGEPKKFFYAELRGDTLHFIKTAPWQDW